MVNIVYALTLYHALPNQGCSSFEIGLFETKDEVGNEINIIHSNCYTDLSNAERELLHAKKTTPRKEWVINTYAIGQCDWAEGFCRV